MANQRTKYSDAQQTALISQVNRICPLCTESLFYKKKSRTYKNYEIAHIYPLNPTKEESELLAGEERLGQDVNDEENVIPLCDICHGKFDKPRTIEEYRYLVDIKKRIIARSQQEEIWRRYAIESEINQVIEAIYNDPDLDVSAEIEFSPEKVDDKLDDTIFRPTHRKIKNNVRDYYVFIKEKFTTLDQSDNDLSDIISLQIKTYYLKQKGMGLTQQVVFENIVAWLNAKTNPDTSDAAEILTSFFIQNCEVFE